jgi:phosphatidyl-myo-inositol dimannoside synthase
MQNVSIQMVNALKRRDDVEVETIILNTSWKYIGIKTFFFLFTLLWRDTGPHQGHLSPMSFSFRRW